MRRSHRSVVGCCQQIVVVPPLVVSVGMGMMRIADDGVEVRLQRHTDLPRFCHTEPVCDGLGVDKGWSGNSSGCGACMWLGVELVVHQVLVMLIRHI